MVAQLEQKSFYDVAQYPSALLQIEGNSVRVPVTYHKSWDDGFGARGWKINATIGDPQIIASTRETGQRINTSVFIHDILDHFLSGFGVSGHRSEAMALIQLSNRTASSPAADYEQMVKEDVLNGRVNGEKLTDFLPAELCALHPQHSDMTDKACMLYLKDKLGEKTLVKSLVDNFFKLGKAGEAHADESWKRLQLDTSKKTQIGEALQTLLQVIDQTVEKLGVEKLHGFIEINNKEIKFTMPEADAIDSIQAYQVAVA